MPSLKDRLATADVLLGGWMVTDDTAVADVLAEAGCDFVGIDQQHGDASLGTTPAIVTALRRSGTSAALVRVPAPEPWLVERALDSGADGVIVPMVESAETAALMCSASRFAPGGTRSYGSWTLGARRFERDAARADAAVLCAVMIETVVGVDQIDRILEAGEPDAVYVGLSDLALSLGLAPGGLQDGDHNRALEHVARACRRHGIAWGAHELPGCPRDRLMDMGAQLVTVCTDLALVGTGARQALVNGA